MNVRQIDVARKAGVSRACVSIVLNPQLNEHTRRIPEKTADRVRRIAREMGYRPNQAAQQLAGARSSVVGLLVDGDYDAMPAGRTTRILFSMEQEAFRLGYRILMGNTYSEDQAREYITDFNSRGVEGILCMHLDVLSKTGNLLDLLADSENVVYYRKPSGIKNPRYVQVDYADGVSQAVHHLVRQGRRRIGLALYSKEPYPMAERLRGYREAAAEVGQTHADKLVWLGKGVGIPHPDLVDDIIDRIVLKEKADALIASNDSWAIALIKRLKKRDIRVPEDVAVVGFDNVEDAALALDPELTSIDHNDEEIGKRMVELVLSPGSDRKNASSRVHIVKPRLVLRESA